MRPIRTGNGGPLAGPRDAGRSRAGIKPPALADVDSPSGTILIIEGTSFDSTYTIPFAGSAALSK